MVVHDCMPAVLRNIYLLDDQGYDVFENIVFQYNKSAIILDNNGKASSCNCTKHMNIKY